MLSSSSSPASVNGVELLGQLAEPDRLRDGHPRVAVHRQGDVGADGVAHAFHADMVVVGIRHGLAADRVLQVPVAELDQVGGLGGELLHRIDRRAVIGGAMGDVHRDLVDRAAEQVMHRVAERLTLDVPQGDVDGGGRAREHAAELALRELLGELRADQGRTQVAVDEVGHHGMGVTGRRPADDAIARLDLDQENVLGARHLAERRRLDRNVAEVVGLDAADLHSWSPW
jgi:hypothetical protein